MKPSLIQRKQKIDHDEIDWDFTDNPPETGESRQSKKSSKDCIRSIGRNVVFEEDFETEFPTEKLKYDAPALGTDLFSNFVIPSFLEA